MESNIFYKFSELSVFFKNFFLLLLLFKFNSNLMNPNNSFSYHLEIPKITFILDIGSKYIPHKTDIWKG